SPPHVSASTRSRPRFRSGSAKRGPVARAGGSKLSTSPKQTNSRTSCQAIRDSMSNSVLFLLIAVGLSVLGTLVVWLQGRPRRPRSSVDMFNQSLRALATTDTRPEPLSGVTVRPLGDLADDGSTDAYDDQQFDDGDYHHGEYEDDS